MKSQNKRLIPRTCILVGLCLLLIATAVLFSWQWRIRTSEQKLGTYVQTLRTLIPESQNAVPEERRDNTMATLSVDGTDFVGILEMPRYNLALPVCAGWGHLTKYPCRFSGSIYNRTLQIGTTSQKGQYDFYREISVGDAVFFTDMEGNRYSLTVTAMHYEKHADQEALTRQDAALTLFIKNIYAFEYLVVFCDVMK